MSDVWVFGQILGSGQELFNTPRTKKTERIFLKNNQSCHQQCTVEHARKY